MRPQALKPRQLNRWPRTDTPITVVAVCVAVLGLADGVGTAWLRTVLPESFYDVGNSGALWAVTAFAVALTLGVSRRLAVMTGLLVLLGETAGYYSYLPHVEHLRVYPVDVIFWSVAALSVGPLIGQAAYYVRRGSGAQRVTAILALCGVVVGEGYYQLRVVDEPPFGVLEIIFGTVGALAALALVPAPVRVRIGALALGALMAVSIYTAYTVIL